MKRASSQENMATSPFTVEFRKEFEAETISLLQKRFLWYTGSISVVGIFAILAKAFIDVSGEVALTRPEYFRYAVSLASLLAYVAAYLVVLLGHISRERVLSLAFGIVIFDGILHVAYTSAFPGEGIGVFGAMLTHFLACCFLPWSPAQALKPLIVLVAINALSLTLFGTQNVSVKLLAIGLSPLVGVPGTAICWLRHSRRLEQFKIRALANRYGEFRRELMDARRIHESLFPRPNAEGDIHYVYLYEPMRQIGGDYLFISHAPTDDGRRQATSVVVIDVTGHGIPAALTVNRLHGELSRLFAEDPGIRPGDVLKLLNRYVHLTLATHSVYVTAVCMRVDPVKQTVEYASGGHPTVFLRAVDGTVQELPSTAFVLGACPDAEFDADPKTLRFGPGDSLIAYTDGALEAKDKDGRMIGTRGLQRVVATPSHCPSGSWPQIILNLVEQHRHGPPADDTLVIEIFHPIGERPHPIVLAHDATQPTSQPATTPAQTYARADG